MARIKKAMKSVMSQDKGLANAGSRMSARFSVRAAACVMAVTAFTSPAMAEGWSIYDLGGTSTKKECLSRAKTAISAYIFNHGGGHTAAASWTVYGYDLTPGDQDAVILCDGDSGTSASLVVHGETTEEDRIFTADQIEIYWNR